MQELQRDPRLPGDPDVDRMWIVRAAEFVAHRRFAMALLVVGVCVLLAALRQTAAAYSSPPALVFEERSETEYKASGGNSYSSDSAYNGEGASPQALSIFVVFGAALTCLGALWLARRFSLLGLLIAVVVIGALGAVPMGVPAEHKGLAHFTVKIGQRLTDEQIVSIEKLLQPAAALATLPKEYRGKLPPIENAGILHVDVGFTKPGSGGYNGIWCEMDLRGDLDETERQALLEFYDYYLNYLVLSAAEARGIKLSEKANEVTCTGSVWAPWRKQWLAARDAENKNRKVEEPKQ